MAFSDAREKIGAAAWIPVAKRKRGVSVKGGQGLTVDQDRTVERVRLATRRNGQSRRAATQPSLLNWTTFFRTIAVAVALMAASDLLLLNGAYLRAVSAMLYRETRSLHGRRTAIRRAWTEAQSC